MEQHLLLGDSKDVLKTIISKRYEVRADGKVISKRTGKELKFFLDEKGYLKSRVYCPEISKNKDGRKPFRQHRLVALFFLDDYDEKKQVNHKNGIKCDNRMVNLEMVTNRENVLHAWRNLDSTERKKKLIERNKKRYEK